MRVHVVVPEGFDNPGQPTGGNIYDRRVCGGLAEAGWEVLVATVAAAWPVPDSGARADLARIVSAIPDGEIALIDGLIASPTAAQLLPHAGRIRMTVLLHMPLATALDTRHDASAQRSERVVLRAATGVVVTSEWTRQQVLTRYEIPACRVHVARPGVDRVAAPARPVRGHLICVGTLGRHKGQDLLVEALAELGDLDWHCVLAGPLDRDPDFVDQLQTRITRLGYGHRVRLTGVLTGAVLSHAYTTADLLVAPSRSETYGMAVTRSARPRPARHSRRSGWAARSARLQHRWHPPRPTDPFRRSGCPRRRDQGLAGRRAPPTPATGRRTKAAVEPARLGSNHTRDSERTDRPRAQQACAARSEQPPWKDQRSDLNRPPPRPVIPNVASQVWLTLTPTCRAWRRDLPQSGCSVAGDFMQLESDQHKVRSMTFRTESRITIASSVREVWAYVCDVARWPEWAPTVLECQVRGGAPLQPGSRVDQRAKGILVADSRPEPGGDRRRGARATWRSPGQWVLPRRAGQWNSSQWTIGRPTP